VDQAMAPVRSAARRPVPDTAVICEPCKTCRCRARRWWSTSG